MVRGVGLDRIIERPREEVKDWLLTRRDFLKMIGITALTLAGVGFAGCSSRGSGSVEFKPQNPLQSGYRLIYPENSKPVPDDVIPHIEEIGKKYFVVYAPSDLEAVIKSKNSKRGHIVISSENVTPGMVFLGFVSKNNYCWIVGDDEAYNNRKTGYWPVELGYPYIKEMSSNIYFVNQNMSTYGLLAIEGVIDGIAITNHTFIEQGGGKVTSFVYKQDLKDRNKYSCYAFHNKEKLNKMWTEIISDYPIIKKELGLGPEEWYKIPDEAYKKWLPC